MFSSAASRLKTTSLKWTIAFLSILAGMLFWSCDLTQAGKNKQTASFTSLWDSISTDDSAVIVFKTEDGHLIDTVFNGRIISVAGFQDLLVEGWDGGKAVIYITAFKAHEIVYSVEKHFNGQTNKTNATIVILSPSVSITSPKQIISLVEGDSIPLPTVIIQPTELADKNIAWSVDHAELMRVGDNYLKALKYGSAHLTAKLVSNPSKTVEFTLLIAANARIPESITLAPDTIFLHAGGASEQLTVKATPSSSSAEVNWTIDDSKIASVSSAGIIFGLQKGNTVVFARSKEKPTVYDSTWIVVAEPLPVETIRFQKDSTTLFIGGAAESLTVEILPPKANQGVIYTVLDPSKVNFRTGSVEGLVEGRTWIIAKSAENVQKADSLLVIVKSKQAVKSLTVSPHSRVLYIGGTSGSLTATVFPDSVTQQVRWFTRNANLATVDETGIVNPKGIGITWIYAQSQVDSTKQDSAEITIKRDSPQVSIGRDTVIALNQTLDFLPVVAAQEFGVVTQFKWDLDGDATWDNSSPIIQSVSYKYDLEKEYTVRFYVRDTEGNETIVSKKVKVIKAPTVTILSPVATGIYLTRAPTLDIEGGANSPNGPGAIKKVSYTVEGVNGSLPTNFSPSGSGTWSIKGIPLVNNSIQEIKIIAVDSFGISGQAVFTVKMDSTPPNPPTVLGTSPTAALPRWTWKSNGGGSGDFRFKLGDSNFATNATEVRLLEYALTSATSSTLYTLYVQERDSAGNWSQAASRTILYDLSRPVVSISAPQSSGIYLTNASTADVAGGSTSPQGDGAIRSITYSVDGILGTLPTNLTSKGAWSIKAIPLLANSTVVIKITATDNLGNQGDASISITMDNSPPLAPTFSFSPPAIVNRSDTSTYLRWTWNRTGPATDSFIVKMNGAEVSRQTGVSYTTNNPIDGNYLLSVSEIDLAGNTSPLTSGIKVLVDRTAPNAPTLSKPLPSGKSATWNWTPGGGGNGSFQCQLDVNAILPCPSPTSYSLTNSPDGDYSLGVRELDDAGNWSSWSASTATLGSPDKAFTLFSFASPSATGTINEISKSVVLTVPYGTPVSALVASFKTTGVAVKIGTNLQTSGVTANNFSKPVTYTILAADKSTQDYVVTVNIASYSYTVTFDGQGATLGPNPATKIVAAPSVSVGTLPTDPQKNGYKFDGWFTGDGNAFLASTVVSQSMTVNAKWTINPPGTPVLVSPTSDSAGLPNSFTLNWKSVNTAASYNIQIASNNSFSGPIVNSTGLTALLYTVSGLSNSTKYYWRVSAANAGGQGAWSVDSFTTQITWALSNNGINHFNIHCLTEANGKIYAGTDGGIYTSSDNGDNWSRLNSFPYTYDVYSIVINGSNIFASITGSDGSVYRSTDGGLNWTLLSVPNIRLLAISGSTVYGSSTEVDSLVYWSGNNGASWVRANNFGMNFTRYDIITGLVKNGSYLWASTSYSGIFRSANNGATWTQVGDYSEPFAVINNTIFANIYKASIYYSIDDGANWTQGQDSDCLPGAIAGVGKKIVAVGNAGPAFSSNGGKTWIWSSGVTSAASALMTNGYMFAGTLSNGIFRARVP